MAIDYEKVQKDFTGEDGVLDLEAYNAEIQRLHQEEIGRQRKEERKAQKEKYEAELKASKKPESGGVVPPEDEDKKVDNGAEALKAVEELKRQLENERAKAQNDNLKQQWIREATESGVDVDAMSALINVTDYEALKEIDVTTLPKKQIKTITPNGSRKVIEAGKKLTIEELASLSKGN